MKRSHVGILYTRARDPTFADRRTYTRNGQRQQGRSEEKPFGPTSPPDSSTMATVTRVEEDPFTGFVDFCSSAIDGEIVSFSDQYFADAINLLNPETPIRRAGYYVPTGAWFDGWETRRHNQSPTDWVIIKLGVTGVAVGCEVDTAFFNGNEAPAISLDACIVTGDESIEDAAWEEIVAKTACGPSQRHFFQFPAPVTKLYTHVRLHQHPDGGIARFRLFGTVSPRFPAEKDQLLDLASVKNGAVALVCSDQHFGRKENILLPGRGKDMGDGWETARSRSVGHNDWVVVKLGAPMRPERVVIDTAYFRGNFPQRAEVYGCHSPSADPTTVETDGKTRWTLLAGDKMTADSEHVLGVSAEAASQCSPVTHVKLVIYPDGGVKRLRVFGKRV